VLKRLIFVAAFLFSATGFAGEPPAVSKKRTVLHFGEDDIRGDITRPDGELVQAPRKAHEESLLRVRRSFADRALIAPLGEAR
jgi:hypothetical protein